MKTKAASSVVAIIALVTMALVSPCVYGTSSKPAATKAKSQAQSAFRIAPLGATLDQVEKYYGPYTHVEGAVGNVWNRSQWQTARQFDQPRRYRFHVSSKGMKIQVETVFEADTSQSQLNPVMRLSYQVFTPDRVLPMSTLMDYLPGLRSLLGDQAGFALGENAAFYIPGYSYGDKDRPRTLAFVNPPKRYIVGFSLRGKDGNPIYYAYDEPVGVDSPVLQASIGFYNPQRWAFDANHLRQLPLSLQLKPLFAYLSVQKGPKPLPVLKVKAAEMPDVPRDEGAGTAGNGFFYDKVTFDPTDRSVSGEIRNASKKNYSEVTFVITFYDRFGDMMDGAQHITLVDISAGDVLPFTVPISVLLPGPSTYKIELLNSIE